MQDYGKKNARTIKGKGEWTKDRMNFFFIV